MALKTFVVVNDITNLSDARYSAGMGVNVLGFKFDSADAEGTKFSEISSWIAGVSFSGIFEGDPAFINAMAAKFELSFIQISDLSLLSTLDLGESQIILNVSVNSQQELEELQSIVATQNEKISYFLIESTNEQIHDALITAIVKSDKQEQMIIGFGLNGDNVNELLENMPNLGGFCLKGSEEERPGYNNYDEVMDVLEALEEY